MTRVDLLKHGENAVEVKYVAQQLYKKERETQCHDNIFYSVCVGGGGGGKLDILN